jgi:hypothetical protein
MVANAMKLRITIGRLERLLTQYNIDLTQPDTERWTIYDLATIIAALHEPPIDRDTLADQLDADTLAKYLAELETAITDFTDRLGRSRNGQAHPNNHQPTTSSPLPTAPPVSSTGHPTRLPNAQPGKSPPHSPRTSTTTNRPPAKSH